MRHRVARVLVFTDLDGTLLDHDTYEPGPAAAALSALRATGVGVVFCSAKTAAEQEALRVRLDVTGPYIVENGGALHLEDETVRFGMGYADVRERLGAAARAAGVAVRGYGDMTATEVAVLTGLDADAAARAKARTFTETFVIDGPAPSPSPALRRELKSRGIRLVSGARFLTAQGAHDKGTAVRALVDLHDGPPRTYGIGDSLNDTEMLEAVDVPMLVKRPDGSWADVGLPGVTRIDGVGPVGWAAAAARITADVFA